MKNQDELITDDVRQIYHLLSQKLREKDYEKANGEFLTELGECTARFRLDKLTQDFLIVKRIYKEHLEAT